MCRQTHVPMNELQLDQLGLSSGLIGYGLKPVRVLLLLFTYSFIKYFLSKKLSCFIMFYSGKVPIQMICTIAKLN